MGNAVLSYTVVCIVFNCFDIIWTYQFFEVDANFEFVILRILRKLSSATFGNTGLPNGCQTGLFYTS